MSINYSIFGPEEKITPKIGPFWTNGPNRTNGPNSDHNGSHGKEEREDGEEILPSDGREVAVQPSEDVPH